MLLGWSPLRAVRTARWKYVEAPRAELYDLHSDPSETRNLIDAFARTGPFPIRHVWQEDEGFRKWRVVNRAIEAAGGDYLIFTDGDCVPRAEVVAAHRARARPGRFLSGGYFRLPMETSGAIDREAVVSQRAFTRSWLAAHGCRPGPKSLKVVARPMRLDGMLNMLTPTKATFNGNNSSCFRADAIRVGGFDERIRYGGGDREFGYRLVHAGVAPIVIRYSALCLHLDHERGYKDAAIRKANEAIIAGTLEEKRIWTEHGLRAS